MVTSTVSRTGIGLLMDVPFVHCVHLEEDKKWCPLELNYKASNQVKWFLAKVGESCHLQLTRHTLICHSLPKRAKTSRNASRCDPRSTTSSTPDRRLE